MNNLVVLEQLTVQQKLDLMEALWNDLGQHADALPSPAWHAAVLAERARALVDGREEIEDWETAKVRIRQRDKQPG